MAQSNVYSHHATITIGHGEVPNTDQSNFPVLVSGTYANLANTTNGGQVSNPNGYDIIFTSDAAGLNKLNFERESYSPTTGQVAFWVEVPVLSHSTDTVFYIFYGNASVTTDPANQNGTWDGNYAGVWHLANGTANDSTSKKDNGTLNGSTPVTGNIAGAMSFDGISSDINFGSKLTKVEPATAVTVSAWVNPSSGYQAPWANIVDYDYSSPREFPYVSYKLSPNNVNGLPNNYEFELSTSNAGDRALFSGVAPVPGTWAYVVGTYDGATQKIYVNGVLKAQQGMTGNIAYSNGNFVLGANGNLTQELWNGVTNEVRVSSVARSADWIAAEYNNQNNPSGFYSISWSQGTGPTTPSTPSSGSGSTSTSSSSSSSSSGSSTTPATPLVATLSANPNSISFGNVNVGGNSTKTVLLTNTGNTSLNISGVSATGAGLSPSGVSVPMTLSAGQSTLLSLSFGPTTAASLNGTVSILGTASNSPLMIAVTGTAVMPQLSMNPTSINFGNVNVGSVGAKTITITNSGSSNLTISQVSASNPIYTISGLSLPATLTPGQSKSFTLEFTPTAGGSATATLSLSSNTPTSPNSVSLSGNGVAPIVHSVVLSWSVSTSSVTGYNVYYSLISGGPYTKMTSSPIQATTYTDPNLQPGQTYYFVVTSVDASGESAYSNEASVTIP